MANQKGERIRNLLAEVRSRYGSFDLGSLRHRSDEDVMTDLVRFHGVGVKTAACVLLFSLGRDVFPVDTHVHRICSRLGLAPASMSPEKTFEAMKAIVPRGKSYSFHTNLIRFGRKICRANNPACYACPLYSECTYEEKRRVLARGPRPSGPRHDFMLLDNV
jgi:endonuclease-3